jgi:exodeoxyribonuclease-3
MKIVSWNVNGIRAGIRKGFFSWLHEYSPDMVCIQETKIHSDQLTDEITQTEGYFSYFFSAQRKGYSGVAVYTKKKPDNVIYGFGNEKFDFEGRVIQLIYDDLYIINTYFPNGKRDDERLNYKYEFYFAMQEYLNGLIKNGKEVLICGDFNTAHNEIDIARPKSNSKISGFLPEERILIDKYIQNGLVDTFRIIHPEEIKYSWWSHFAKSRERNVGWRIDYIFVSKNIFENVKKADILDFVEGSDHCPIMIDLTL